MQMTLQFEYTMFLAPIGLWNIVVKTTFWSFLLLIRLAGLCSGAGAERREQPVVGRCCRDNCVTNELGTERHH